MYPKNDDFTRVRNAISCLGVCYADDPKKRWMWRLRLPLIYQLLFEVNFLSLLKLILLLQLK